jgi:hypothetical protein
MPVSDWADMMPFTVEHSSLIGRTDHGEPLYGTPVAYSARVVHKASKVKAADGSDILVNGYVWLSVYVLVKEDDRITLPDGSTPAIVMLERQSDEVGHHHTKIYFG